MERLRERLRKFIECLERSIKSLSRGNWNTKAFERRLRTKSIC